MPFTVDAIAFEQVLLGKLLVVNVIDVLIEDRRYAVY